MTDSDEIGLRPETLEALAAAQERLEAAVDACKNALRDLIDVE